MSYEIDRIEETKCLCGRGNIKKTVKSNDWLKIKENIEIECEACKEKYEIVREYFCPKPKYDYIIYYLKNKENDEKIKLEL